MTYAELIAQNAVCPGRFIRATRCDELCFLPGYAGNDRGMTGYEVDWQEEFLRRR